MKILRLIKTFIVMLPVLIFYDLKYIRKYNKHPEKYSINERYLTVQKEIRILLKLLHVNAKFEGLDKFYNLNSKALMISNHLSFIDPLIIIAESTKPITFVAKKETFNMPFIGRIAKAIEVFPLDRHNLMNQISSIKEIVSYLKDQNKPSVAIYIEGTRNKHPENPCLDFHPGTLKFALMANVPLIVVASYGSFRALDTKSYLKDNPVNFRFIEVLNPEELKGSNTTELANKLKDTIDSEVDKLRKVDLDCLRSLNLKEKKFDLESACDIRVKS